MDRSTLKKLIQEIEMSDEDIYLISCDIAGGTLNTYSRWQMREFQKALSDFRAFAKGEKTKKEMVMLNYRLEKKATRHWKRYPWYTDFGCALSAVIKTTSELRSPKEILYAVINDAADAYAWSKEVIAGSGEWPITDASDIVDNAEKATQNIWDKYLAPS